MIFCAFNLSMLQNSCFRQTVECTDKLMKQTVLTRVCLLRSKYYYVQLCCLWKASKWFSSSLGVSAPPQVLAGEGKCLAQSPGTCYFGGMQGLAFTYQSLQQWRCGETQVSHQRAPNMSKSTLQINMGPWDSEVVLADIGQYRDLGGAWDWQGGGVPGERQGRTVDRWE